MTNIIEIISKDLIEKNGGCDVEDIFNVLLQFNSFNFKRSFIHEELKKLTDIVQVEGVYTFPPREVFLPRTALAEKLNNNVGKNVEVTFGVKRGGTDTLECKVMKVDSIGRCHIKRKDDTYRQYDNDRLKMVKVGNTTYRLKK
jgi:hypothetical protein